MLNESKNPKLVFSFIQSPASIKVLPSTDSNIIVFHEKILLKAKQRIFPIFPHNKSSMQGVNILYLLKSMRDKI